MQRVRKLPDWFAVILPSRSNQYCNLAGSGMAHTPNAVRSFTERRVATVLFVSPPYIDKNGFGHSMVAFSSPSRRPASKGLDFTYRYAAHCA